MSGFESDFQNLVPLTGHTVTVANGQVLKVPAKGMVTTLWQSTTGATRPVSIECLFVPGLVARLFSVYRACEQGDEVTFSGINSSIRHGGHTYELRSDRASFHLDTRFGQNVETEHSYYTTHQSKTPGVWHHRLGHVSNEKLRALQAMGSLGACKLKSCDFCEVCRARQTNTPQLIVSVPKALKRGDRVHIDLMGPFNSSVGGKRWVMVFVDSATSFVHVSFLTRKSEAATALEDYVMTILKPLNITLTCLFADNGGEFRGGVFHRLSVKYSFRREFSSPGTPAQNGIAERCNRTLMEITRSLFFQSGAPLDLWTCAIHTAAYILNRVPQGDASLYSCGVPRLTSHWRICVFGGARRIGKLTLTKINWTPDPALESFVDTFLTLSPI